MSAIDLSLKNPVDKIQLEQQVKAMYRDVALHPQNEYHFEMGRKLAIKLGYPLSELDMVPPEAVDSFAGVGYHFQLADIKPGESILELGSGSGMDLFFASNKVGPAGYVTGVDMTAEQVEKSRMLARKNNYANVTLLNGHIEKLLFLEDTFDVVISNGVINLSSEKEQVFKQVGKVLKKGGRMVISDIVSEKQMPESITCNSSLWTACIAGAMQIDDYLKLIEQAGMKIWQLVNNDRYEFLSRSAINTSRNYGVKSISIEAEKI